MTVLYLKYRPHDFSQLDNIDARESLIKIFASKNIPHALLFTGPKGIGKTSAARIVAKALNCEQNDLGNGKYEPCNKCNACKAIDTNQLVDVFEIDAASNRGIDDIRDLREKIKLSPANSRVKVYIIDEVHMLTSESFNALLKTLEEPPKHAYFILCTTDYDKVPKTIVSRCTRIHFKKASKTELLAKLKQVTVSENISFDEGGLNQIAKHSDGSFRDAIKLLEQASSLGSVDDANAMKVVGLNQDYSASQLLELIEKGSVEEALQWVFRAEQANVNVKLLIEEMTDKLRLLMLKTFGITTEDSTKDYVFSLDQITLLIRLLMQANYDLRQATIPSLPLELALVDYFNKSGTTQSDRSHLTGDNKDTVITAEVSPSVISQTVFVPDSKVVDGANKDLSAVWPEILAEVKPLNHSVLAFLRASRPIDLDQKGNLTVEVFYKFHKDQLETDRCRKIFEQAAGKVLACDVRLKCILGEGKPRPTAIEEPIYEIQLEKTVLPHQPTDDIIDIAEKIFNGGGTIQ